MTGSILTQDPDVIPGQAATGEPRLPRRLPQGLALVCGGAAFLLFALGGYVLDNTLYQTGVGILGCLFMGVAVDLENLALTRHRAHIYHDLHIPVPTALLRGLHWRLSPADALVLLLAAYMLVGGLNSVRRVPDWVLLSALVLLITLPFVGGYLWLRRLTLLRRVTIRSLARELGLEVIEKTRFGREREYVLYGAHNGRQVQLHTDGQAHVAVLVEEFGGEGLWLRHATWRSRKTARHASDLLSTGDAAFDRRFVVRGTATQRSHVLLADPDLRQHLLVLRELAPLELIIGGNGLWLRQDYARADENYLKALLAIGVSLARRWDGHEVLDFPV